MPIPADRDMVQELMATRGAQVVEVLPRAEYDWAHIAGAAHLWLRDMGPATVRSRLAADRPVVVYCNDLQCDMSPRAAARLERLGFEHVYDYMAGKMDWLSYGLPHDGAAHLAGDVVRRDVLTCRPEEPVSELRLRLAATGNRFCVVTSSDSMVLGVLQEPLDDTPAGVPAQEVMDFGLTTVRPSEDLGRLVERMRRAGVDAILVTRSDAILVGVLLRSEAEQLLARAAAPAIPSEEGL